MKASPTVFAFLSLMTTFVVDVRCGHPKMTDKLVESVESSAHAHGDGEDAEGIIRSDAPMTTAGAPEKPPETITARRISKSDWTNLTEARVEEVKDPHSFQDMLDPRSEAFINFRRDVEPAAANIIVNSTIVNATFDGDNSTVHSGNKRGDNATSTTDVELYSNDFGIYIVTGVVAAICVIGLLAIVCVARANGQRARDYEFGARRVRRERNSNGAAANGWRRSQDYLNHESGGGRDFEDRSILDGGGQVNQQSMQINRVEDDVTDV